MGGPADPCVHYICSGRVRAVLHGPGGQDRILAIFDPGALIGCSHLWFRPRQDLACYAATLTKTWSWPRVVVLAMLHDHPEIAVCLLSSLARKVQMLTAQIHALSFDDAAGRVLRTFAHLAGAYGEPAAGGAVRIGLRLTQSEVGAMAGASRVTVNKVFRRLEAAGVMTKRGGYFIIHDLAKLPASGPDGAVGGGGPTGGPVRL